MKLLLITALFVAGLPQASDPTLPPPSAQVRLTVDGLGVQIYRCTPQPGNIFQWVFEAPEAKLLDRSTHEQLGTHGAGPTWTWNDGSSITGKVIQTKPSSDPTAIPWLLLETKPTGEIKGTLNGITMVRRSDTQAGAAPSYGCDAERANTLIRVPYAAVYTFYSDSAAK
jgi:hypothetical protein